MADFPNVDALVDISFDDRMNDSNAEGDVVINRIHEGERELALAVTNKVDETINVKDHGATGDGVTNDAAAFTAAIAAVPASGGEILLPETDASYLLSTTITWNKPLRLKAVGRSVKISVGADDRIVAGASNVIVEGVTFTSSTQRRLFSQSVSGVEYENWTFRDCTFENLGVRCTKPGRFNDDGIEVTTGTAISKDVVFDNCEFFGYANNYTLDLAGVTGALVQGCHIHDAGIDISAGDGIKVDAGSANVRIIGNHIHDMTRDGCDAYDSLGVVFVDNEVHDCAGWGFEVKRLDSGPNDPQHSRVIGNRIYNCALGGIDANTHNTAVIGNTLTNNGTRGIRVSVSSDGSPTGTTQVAIVGNVCNDHSPGTTGQGILLSGAVSRVVVTGNQCNGNRDGIASSSTSFDCVFAGNICFDNTNRGLSINGTGGHVVYGNRSQDTNNAVISGGAVSQVYTATNALTDRAFDANATTVEELADVVATLIADLRPYGLVR